MRDLRGSAPSLRFDPGWRAWKESTDEAVLVLDGVDEAMFRGCDIQDVFEPVRGLTPAQRARLRVIALTRDDDSRDAALRALGDAVLYRLLPSDVVEARRELGPDTERAIQRVSSLEGLPHPISMQWLRMLAEPSIRPDRIREHLLLHECRAGLDDDAVTSVSGEALLRVAGRMAAVLALSDLDEVRIDTRPPGVSRDASLIAGRDADAFRAFLRSAALAHEGATYRFRSRDTEERLTAFAIHALTEPVVRELMTDSRGRLRPELDDIARELVAIDPRWKAPVQRWRDTLVPAVPEQTARSVIDRIAELEQPRVAAGLRKDTLARLDHPSVRDRARHHACDRTRSPAARAAMLEIASALAWPELVEPAIAIALDAREDSRLRAAAAYLVGKCGEPSIIERLRELVERPEAPRLSAIGLSALLHAGRVTVLEAATLAPPPDQGLTDERTLLIVAIERRLTVGDARVVLARASTRVPNVEPAIPKPILAKLAPTAVERVSSADEAWDETLASDVAAFMRQDMTRKGGVESSVERRLQRDARARALLYRALLGVELHYVVRNALTAEDAGWLLELARSMDRATETIAADLNLLLWRLPEDDAARASIEELLRTSAPDRWAEWDEARRRAPEARASWEARQRSRAVTHAGAPRRTLVSALQEVRAEVADPTPRLRLLARLCFAEEGHGYTNIDGRFERLPREVRRDLILEVRSLLTRAESSEVPAGTSFTSHLVDEAAAFRSALLWDDDLRWLTDALVRAWLPSVLFLAHDGECAEVVRRCFHAHRAATIEVVETAVARDARAGRYPVSAQALPTELWAENLFVDHIVRLLDDPLISIDAREPLLRLMASRAERVDAMPVLRRIAHSEHDLRLAAIAALVAIAPREGIPIAEQVVVDVTSAARAFRLLIEQTEIPQPNLSSLSTDELLRLTCTLFRVVTLEHPRWEAFSRSDEERVYDLRTWATNALAPRADFDPATLMGCIDDVAARDRAHAWIASIRDSEEVDRVLASLDAASPRPPFDRVIAALDDARTIHLRSVEDLFHLLLRGLEAAANDSRDYVELVRGVEPKGGLRDWPNERSLQAYVLLRIREILATSRDHENDVIHREVQEQAGNDRLDFAVIPVGNHASVGSSFELPVEVKWSHNSKCVESLSDQLGRRYVLEKGRTHGLYVVGFSGGDLASLRERLEKARAEFEHAHRVKLGVVILPFAPPT